MLKIINNLKPFFEDCYKEIGVREYSRLMKISPPTASKLLKYYAKEGLLKTHLDRGYLLFRANRESRLLLDLSRIYWNEELKEIVKHLMDVSPKTIILFGSLSKLETTKDSDIDIALIDSTKKNFELSKFEKKYKREIQIFTYKSLGEINKDIKFNILNGFILGGYL